MAKPRKGKDPEGMITRSALRQAAGPVYFSRGEEYFELDTVSFVHERKGNVNATVHGTHLYKTSLWIEDGRVQGRCSCPLGQEREFCKHLVAAGLAYIKQNDGSRRKKKSGGKTLTPKDIERYLSKQSVSNLVQIIMEQADLDDEFYAMLRMSTATDEAKPNTSEMRRVIRQAIGIDDFIHWNETYGYIRRVDRVLDKLRTMLVPQYAAGLIELAEYSFDVWEEAIQHIDDSDGCMSIILDSIYKLHFEACKIAKPDSVALAERLFKRTLRSEWDIFDGAYDVYRDVLGKDGRKRYRELVEMEWSKVPHVKPGHKSIGIYGRCRKLQSMMLAIAEDKGDLDLVIDILSRDLSQSYVYLQIAERCRKARKYKLAREWAENGLAAFHDGSNSRLRVFLADEYLRAKRSIDAVEMIWANFVERTSVETYKDLAKYAKKIKHWPEWREKAFVHMRKDIRKQKAEYKREYGNKTKADLVSRWNPSPPDHSLLVSVLLWEKKEDEAWDEAKQGGCSEGLWLELARLREKHHPEDAVEIFSRQVETLINQTNNHSYKQAVDFLDRIYGLMKRIGKEKKFHDDLMQLKTDYKRKRNFIKYVERKVWGK